MSRYLDPKNDLTFKLIFGTHKHLCISLLNSILPFDETRRVIDIEYGRCEMVPELDILKDPIVDVRCTDSTGCHFIVEMQMYWTESFKSRILLYASKAYVMQLDSSQKYDMLHPVYALTFVDQNFEKSPEMKEEYYRHYKIVNINHTEKQIEGLEFVFIELRKFVPSNRTEKKLHELWLRFLTEINESTEEISSDLLENEEIGEAVLYTEKAGYTKAQLEYYDSFRDRAMKEQSALADAKKEGLAEGKAKGLLKREAEGRAKEKELTVMNGHESGFTVAQLSRLTGLTEDQVRTILKKYPLT
jgi:predicted transposase/invertase (TIGR01784 family)